MKVYKVVLMVIDFDGLGKNEIQSILENNHYPNHCMSPNVVEIDSKDIGEWDDSNLLNNSKTSKAEFDRLFSAQD